MTTYHASRTLTAAEMTLQWAARDLCDAAQADAGHIDPAAHAVYLATARTFWRTRLFLTMGAPGDYIDDDARDRLLEDAVTLLDGCPTCYGYPLRDDVPTTHYPTCPEL
jgi:hypothetical protein